MDSLLIRPKDDKELTYIKELMDNVGALYRQVSQEATEEFEMAMLIKDRMINTAGIIRRDGGKTKLTMQEQLMLTRSEEDIKDRLIITERKIQHEEDEWLNQ